ncbi:hypothetical protein CBS101457_004587 [Exobasidium rhododendri]|nr:hypothetical protein CBS101457_004587 [Exobasidium rhododendri]
MNLNAVPRSPGNSTIDLRSPFNFQQQEAAFNAQHAASVQMRGVDQQRSHLDRDSNESSNDSEAFQDGGFSFPVSANTSLEEQNSMAAITKIGSLLERVNELASTARQSFLDGQHAQSSLCLGDLQRSLTEIGELGSRSLAQVIDPSEASRPIVMERTPSLGHRRNLTESALKKRPLNVSTNDVEFSPFKTLRTQDGTPIHPVPPPSAPPMMYDGLGNGNSVLSASSSINAPLPPPSAPPYFASPLSGPPQSSIATVGTPLTALTTTSMHQEQQQAMQDLLISTSQQQQQQQTSQQMRAMISQSPVLGQGQFTSNFPFSTIGTSQASMMLPSSPSTPGPGPIATHASLNGSLISDGASSHSLQMAFQPLIPVPPSTTSSSSSPQQEKMSNLDGATTTMHNRMRSSSGRMISSESSGLGMEEAQDGSLLSSERGMSGANVPPELKSRLDHLFFHFLEKVCSDVDYSDNKGEHLHQILTAKKMSRSSLATTSFKAFKFRIQAFTNAFHEEVQRSIGEEECNLKQTRAYLWTSNYIARFNESGVKEKSKGNHVWRVEARKNVEGRFEFREFKRKIIVPTLVAYHGLNWTWPLRIWDPQAPSTSIKAVFGAQNLPSWIRWKEGDHPILYGTPDPSCPSTQLVITAHYVARGHQQLVRLSATVDLQVAPLLESTTPLPPVSDQILTNIQDSEQTMEEMDISQAESVIAPSQVAHVMSQIDFPYTPPVPFNPRQQYFANDGQMTAATPTTTTTTTSSLQENDHVPLRQPLPSAPLPQQGGSTLLQPHAQIQHNQIRDLMARQEQAAATMQLSMPTTIRRRMTDHQSHQDASSIRAQAQQQQQEQLTQQQAMAQAAAVNAQEQQQMQQMQQIQHQQHMAVAASEMMMQQQQQPPPLSSMAGTSLSSHANMGLTLTPMSSMPQMADSLPNMTQTSNNPMLSPALPMGFDPIAQEGARIAAIQQQQQQHHHLHLQQQQQQQQQHALSSHPPTPQHNQSMLMATDQDLTH